jgi:quinone-modifying oxidoreductase subunit QmoC
MEPAISIRPDPEFRAELLSRGGWGASRCFQCATCSAVCDLSTDEIPFPRQQMLWAQWGLVDRLASDPGVWLCHQCNDCTTRCPRDARPGDALQVIRGLMIEEQGAPRFVARLVGRARSTWPLLVGLPILFWVALAWSVHAFRTPALPLSYGEVIPHWLIYSVFFPAVGLAALAATVGVRRAWRAWGASGRRQGSLTGALVKALGDVLAHRRFGRCEAAKPRQLGHLALFWGFVGAAVTSGLIIVALYGLGEELPLPQHHPFKILGNISAVLLAIGVVWLVAARLSGDRLGASRAYDNFFLLLVVALVATGIAAELGRYYLPPMVAIGIYVAHLGIVLSLFLTFPYSKFAHALYRTAAMAHERMTAQRRPS